MKDRLFIYKDYIIWESMRRSDVHVCDHSRQVWKTRIWITLWLWESQWVEESRGWVPPVLHPTPSMVPHWKLTGWPVLTAMTGGVAGSTGSLDSVGLVNSPHPVALPMPPLGVAPSQLSLRLVQVCWSLTSLCHSNGHIETMPVR